MITIIIRVMVMCINQCKYLLNIDGQSGGEEGEGKEGEEWMIQ